MQDKDEKEKVTFNVDKEGNFSDWFTEIVKKAELADIRYNIKGFVVFQSWSVIPMELMYRDLEKELQETGHKPYWFPTVIPEKNFYLEKEHVEGFSPEVFWVTETGAGEKLEEKLALRPTSETAFYQMFSLWIRSYNDLPFKSYQRAQVFRYETKATRPFLRSREFYWIESHNAFSSREEALKQIKEDMEITKKLVTEKYSVPLIYFERPQWDKFAGAESSFAADTLMPDGRVIQLPATHLLSQQFPRAFNIKFVDKKGEEKCVYTTCYGPCVSRNFAAVISVHGDNNGLVFPFSIAPVQVIIIPIFREGKNAVNKKIEKEAEAIKNKLSVLNLRAEIDYSDERIGNKFYFWEMKGIPIRIELGEKELKQKKLLVFRRDEKKKELTAINSIPKKISLLGKGIDKNLLGKAEKKFNSSIVNASSLDEAKKGIEGKKIVRSEFCSIGMEAGKCAEVIEKELAASIRGKRVDKKEVPKGKCIVCGKKAEAVVYIAKSY